MLADSAQVTSQERRWMMTIDVRRPTVRSRRPRLLGVLVTTFALCGGGSLDSSSAELSESRVQTAMWHIRFTQSGGFAGMQREMEVTSAGEVTARDLRRKHEVKGRVDDAELARLRTLLTEAPPGSAAASGPGSRCRDCVEYGVDATIDGRQVAARMVDMQLDASGFAPLVNALVDILTRTLAPTQL
jgi:hypothetical protein